MKKILMMILIAVTTLSCGKDEPAEKAPEKPSIEMVKLSKNSYPNPAGSGGSLYYLDVRLTLNLPEEGAVKALDYIKDGTRHKDKGPVLKNGVNQFTIFGGGSELLNGTYTFILVLKDGTEVSSAPEIVK